MLRGILRAIDRRLGRSRVDRMPGRWPERGCSVLSKLGPGELEIWLEGEKERLEMEKGENL